jgi:hypothetical protein
MTGAAAMRLMDAMEGHVLPVTFSWHLGFQTPAYRHRSVCEPGGRKRSIALLRPIGNEPVASETSCTSPSDTNKWGQIARVGAASDPIPEAVWTLGTGRRILTQGKDLI